MSNVEVTYYPSGTIENPTLLYSSKRVSGTITVPSGTTKTRFNIRGTKDTVVYDSMYIVW